MDSVFMASGSNPSRSRCELNIPAWVVMTDERIDRIERYLQMLFGFCLWGYMLYTDLSAGVELSELSVQQMSIMAVRYGFAAILIKGTTISEVSELIRAWKGK